MNGLGMTRSVVIMRQLEMLEVSEMCDPTPHSWRINPGHIKSALWRIYGPGSRSQSQHVSSDRRFVVIKRRATHTRVGPQHTHGMIRSHHPTNFSLAKLARQAIVHVVRVELAQFIHLRGITDELSTTLGQHTEELAGFATHERTSDSGAYMSIQALQIFLQLRQRSAKSGDRVRREHRQRGTRHSARHRQTSSALIFFDPKTKRKSEPLLDAKKHVPQTRDPTHAMPMTGHAGLFLRSSRPRFADSKRTPISVRTMPGNIPTEELANKHSDGMFELKGTARGLGTNHRHAKTSTLKGSTLRQRYAGIRKVLQTDADQLPQITLVRRKRQEIRRLPKVLVHRVVILTRITRTLGGVGPLATRQR